MPDIIVWWYVWKVVPVNNGDPMLKGKYLMHNKIVFSLTVVVICLICCNLTLSQSTTKPSDSGNAHGQENSGYSWVKMTDKAAYAPRDGA
ncbi:hypothetical protein ACFL47_00330, partial [Candidatus Latescibacterota bacterium]